MLLQPPPCWSTLLRLRAPRQQQQTSDHPCTPRKEGPQRPYVQSSSSAAAFSHARCVCFHPQKCFSERVCEREYHFGTLKIPVLLPDPTEVAASVPKMLVLAVSCGFCAWYFPLVCPP